MGRTRMGRQCHAARFRNPQAIPRARSTRYRRRRGQGIRMGRGRRGFFDDLIKLPWPVALAVGMLGYAAIRHGIPAFFARQGGPFGQAFASQSDVFAPLAWMFLAACTLCALVAFANARKRRRLLDTQTGLDSIAAIGWRDFERLVGEAFRRQGYSVEETGLGGADGGIDLILRKDSRRTLVQCKHWRRRLSLRRIRSMPPSAPPRPVSSTL